MKKILVATNFGPAAHHATEYTVELAETIGADVYLINVFWDPMPAVLTDPWTIRHSPLYKQHDEQMTKELKLLRQKYSGTIKGDVKGGVRGDAIAGAAESMGADLIVVGSKREEAETMYGSTAVKLVRKTNIPVLVLPEGARFTKWKHLVMAVDFTRAVNNHSLEPLLQLTHLFEPSLHVLHVESSEKRSNAREEDTKADMGRVLGKFTYTYDRLVSDDVLFGIYDFVNHHPADLLVMIAHHHSLFNWSFGSTHTPFMSLESPVPILILKDWNDKKNLQHKLSAHGNNI